jgi:hypothetical protein
LDISRGLDELWCITDENTFENEKWNCEWMFKIKIWFELLVEILERMKMLVVELEKQLLLM